MNFLIYQKAAKDENAKFKKRIILLENTRGNSLATLVTNVEVARLCYKNAALRKKVYNFEEEAQLSTTKLDIAIRDGINKENEKLNNLAKEINKEDDYYKGENRNYYSRSNYRGPYNDRTPLLISDYN